MCLPSFSPAAAGGARYLAQQRAGDHEVRARNNPFIQAVRRLTDSYDSILVLADKIKQTQEELLVRNEAVVVSLERELAKLNQAISSKTTATYSAEKKRHVKLALYLILNQLKPSILSEIPDIDSDFKLYIQSKIMGKCNSLFRSIKLLSMPEKVKTYRSLIQAIDKLGSDFGNLLIIEDLPSVPQEYREGYLELLTIYLNNLSFSEKKHHHKLFSDAIQFVELPDLIKQVKLLQPLLTHNQLRNAFNYLLKTSSEKRESVSSHLLSRLKPGKTTYNEVVLHIFSTKNEADFDEKKEIANALATDLELPEMHDSFLLATAKVNTHLLPVFYRELSPIIKGVSNKSFAVSLSLALAKVSQTSDHIRLMGKAIRAILEHNPDYISSLDLFVAVFKNFEPKQAEYVVASLFFEKVNPEKLRPAIIHLKKLDHKERMPFIEQSKLLVSSIQTIVHSHEVLENFIQMKPENMPRFLVKLNRLFGLSKNDNIKSLISRLIVKSPIDKHDQILDLIIKFSEFFNKSQSLEESLERMLDSKPDILNFILDHFTPTLLSIKSQTLRLNMVLNLLDQSLIELDRLIKNQREFSIRIVQSWAVTLSHINPEFERAL